MGAPLYTPYYPTKADYAKEVTLPESATYHKHKVLYRPSQVERCLGCYGIKITKGLRLAMLVDTSEFRGTIPKPRFFVGTVTKIWGNPSDPLMTITWDGGPAGAISMSCSIKHYENFCIPLAKGWDAKAPAKRKPIKRRAPSADACRTSPTGNE